MNSFYFQYFNLYKWLKFVISCVEHIKSFVTSEDGKNVGLFFLMHTSPLVKGLVIIIIFYISYINLFRETMQKVQCFRYPLHTTFSW